MIKLNTTESINTVALAYLDDITEELKEVEGSDLRIGVSSFSSTKQRLYLIGDYIYNYPINVICEPVEGYEIKVDMGKKHTKDLSTLSNSVTGDFTASTYKFSNAIPINIYINSKTLTERTLDLVIKIIIGELNLEISCVGATNWFGVGQGLGVNNENPTVPLTGFRIVVNDVEYPYEIDPGFFGPYALPEDYPLPEDIESGAAVRNITGDYLRLEYQLLPENQDQFTLMFFGDNPTISELGRNHWGVCLSPTEISQISCDGATDTSNCMSFTGTCDIVIDGVTVLVNASEEEVYNYFRDNEDYIVTDCEDSSISCAGAMPLVIFTPGTNKQWDIKINGVLHSTDTQNIIEYLQSHPELNLFTADVELAWAIANFGAENQRIELISKVPNPVIEFYTDEQTPLNPTASIKDGSVFACLSVAPEPEPEPEPTSGFSPMAVNNAGNVLAGYQSGIDGGNTLQLYTFSGTQLDISNNLLKVALPSNPVSFAADDSVLVTSVYDGSDSNYTLTAVARSLNGEYDLPVSFTPEFKSGSFYHAVNHNGEYIIAAQQGYPIQIYQRQTQTSYQKIGEFGESSFFFGLSFAPDGTKVSFFSGGGTTGIKVYSFEAGVTELLGNMEYLAHEAHGTTRLGLPVWVHNDVLVHSYAWLADDNSTIYKGFFDIIKVDSNGPQLLSRDDTLGANYYQFSTTPQMGKLLFRNSSDDGKRVLGVDSTGYVDLMLDLPDLGDGQYVLLPNGNLVVYGIFSADQIGVINTIN